MLPAPRDPHEPEAVPPDPPPDPPPLAAQLTTLLRSAGAQAMHAIHGERGEVLAEAGLAAGDDVPALAQLARAAGALGRGRGEWVEDLVVTLGRTVHVLRECDGVVLHARLDPASGDVGAVRRGLASAGLRRAAEAAGRAATTTGTTTGTAAGAPPAGAGTRTPSPAPAPARRTHRSAAEPSAAPPAAAAPAGPGRDPRRGPPAETAWPYSVPQPSPEPPPDPSPPPNRRPAHAAEDRRPAEPADRRGDDRAGPQPDATATAPSMRPVPPQPRRVPAHPLPSVPAQARPHPISRPTPLPTPLPTLQPAPRPTPGPTPQPPVRPSPKPRSGRVPEPPRVPLPRSAGGPAPAGRDPALVAVDGGMPLTGSGALAVLALPPAALPHRRRVAPARPAQSPRGFVTPAVLRQPWASDVPTMRRMLAGLHRMN